MNDYKKIVKEFLISQDYSADAISSLTEAIDKIVSTDALKIIQKIDEAYKNNPSLDYEKLLVEIKDIALLSGVSEKRAILAVFLCLTKTFKAHYEKAGYPDEIYFETVKELKYKMQECVDLYGEYGATNGLGFAIFFSLKRFGMGILQFEVIDFNRTATIDGVKLSPTDKVINIHIPKSGAPYTAELRKEAYLKAKEFFKKDFIGKDKVPFFCHSWLMFKKHREILKPTSNLIKFADEFTIFAEYEFDDYTESWRLFNKVYTRPEDMPTETSLQRAYVDLMKRGEKTGGSEGIFFL